MNDIISNVLFSVGFLVFLIFCVYQVFKNWDNSYQKPEYKSTLNGWQQEDLDDDFYIRQANKPSRVRLSKKDMAAMEFAERITQGGVRIDLTTAPSTEKKTWTV